MSKEKKITKEFKKMILKKARIHKGTQTYNVKLGNMGSWAMLFGNIEWEIPELGMTVKGTCGNHCKGCFNPENPRCSECYVAKSYVRKTKRNEDGTVGDIVKNACTVKLGHAYRTIAMTMFRKELLLSLDAQLTLMKKKMDEVRINESGELTCFEDLELWCELGRRHPETVFYMYTKNYGAVRKAIEKGIIPENVFINISIWHEFGIKPYLEMKDNKQIRAFVLVDSEWTKERYMKKGVEINCMCGAYDEKGKMNHDITCDKCGICYGYKCKVCGCYEH